MRYFLLLFIIALTNIFSTDELTIDKISLESGSSGFEVLVCFNRKLEQKELLPDRSKNFKYSYEYKLESKNDWETSSKSVMSNLSIEDNLRNSNQCYVLTSIGKGKIIQKDLNKGDIKTIQVKIFKNTNGIEKIISELESKDL
jgi:hypothetical protein